MHSERIQNINFLREKKDFLQKFGGTDSFLLLEPDATIERYCYVGQHVEGYLGFAVSLNTAIVMGGIICAKKDMLALVSEFKTFCEFRYKRIVFFNIKEEPALLLKQLNCQILTLGDEALLYPETFTVAGRRMKNVRQTAKKAEQYLTVREVKTLDGKKDIYPQLVAIDKEFLMRKGTEEMGFFTGSLNLDNLENKRLFVAESVNGIEGYVFCYPMYPGNNYRPELYRKKFESPGVIELILCFILEQLKKEKISCFTLGISPLVEDTENVISDKTWHRLFLLTIGRIADLFVKFSPGASGPKSVKSFKSKFRPVWIPCFSAYYPKISIVGILACLNVWGFFKLRKLKLIKYFLFGLGLHYVKKVKHLLVS